LQHQVWADPALLTNKAAGDVWWLWEVIHHNCVAVNNAKAVGIATHCTHTGGKQQQQRQRVSWEGLSILQISRDSEYHPSYARAQNASVEMG
jgi:hypothetical protein